MVDITKTVGDLGSNANEDVALVQLMLRVVRNAKGLSYFSSNYNGNYDQTLKAAITAFQQDQKLVAVKTPGDKQLPPVAGLNEKPGLVAPGSKTLSTLVAKLPADLKNIRIIPGTKTIYVEGNQNQAVASAQLIRGNPQLGADFRDKVAKLVDTMYKDHKIALDLVPNTGGRRDFTDQAKVANASSAGPGESNHQYGNAVDIGFKGFKWVAGDGTIKTDSFWLEHSGLPLDKRLELWAARNAIAFKQLGLFQTNKLGDYVHIQGFSDDTTSMGRSLAKLLETVSPAKAKWSFAGRVEVDKKKYNTYKVDVGLGTPLGTGKAIQVWNGEAPISKAELANALNAKLASDANFSVEKFFGVKAAPNVNKNAEPAKAVPLKEADIKADYIKHLQNILKTDIEAAEKSWDRWVPVK